MAIGIGQLNENEYEKEQKGLLEVSAYDYYFDNMRPFLQEMMLKCKTDNELLRTIDKVINAGDSFCQQKNYEMLSESFDVLENAITDPFYFNGIMKKAPEGEKEMVRKLADKISDLKMIIKCEPPQAVKEKKIKERIGYISPNGENEDYDNHNMKKLCEPNPRKRIPNK